MKYRLLFIVVIILLIAIACKETEKPLVSIDFASSDTLVLEGSTINFTDLSTGKPNEWNWNFEGGNPLTSDIQNPIIQYNSSGVFNVSLFASNGDKSGIKEVVGLIKVIEKVETKFSFIPSVNVGDPVQFQDLSKGFPNDWNWTFQNAAQSSSQAQNPVVIFTTAGLNEITLTASNELSSDIYTALILVLPTDGLILNYNFNGNALDKSTNQNHGQIFGPVPTYDKVGNLNSAYYFDGFNDEIKFPFSNSFLTLPFTVSCWIKFDSFSPAILGNDLVNSQQTGVWLSMGKAPETLDRIGISIGNGDSPSPESRRTFVADKILELGRWYHIVGIVENKNSMSIYIDNQAISGFYTGFADSYYHSSNHGSLGRVWDPSSFFHGILDDLRIYNRTLTTNEINLLFQE